MAGRRDVYYPVAYIAPLQGNLLASGFDLGSNAPRLQAIVTAITHSGVVATAGITLVQESQQQQGVLLVQAIRPHQKQSGVVTTVLRMGDFMNKLLPEIQSVLSHRLIDLDDEQVLQSTFSDDQLALYHYDFEFGTRHYRLETAPTPSYYKSHRGWSSWAVLVVGVFCTSLLGALLLLSSGYGARMGAQVVARTRELTESQVYNQSILDNVLDGIITLDESGHVQRLNESAQLLLWRDDVDVQSCHLTAFLAEPFASEYAQYFSVDLAGLQRVLGIGREVLGLRQDGSSFPMELALTPMQLGERVLFNAIVRDITERARVDKIKSEFIATVSHELRTPLTAISGSLSLLNGGVLGELPVQAKSIVNVALRNSERLIFLVNDILNMEKLNSGSVDYVYQVVNLAKLLPRVLESNQGYALRYGVSCVQKGLMDDVYVKVDEQRFVQVLTNLLSNAIKFSLTGDVVVIEMSVSEGRVRVEVTDHGVGISDEFRMRIFQPFAQSDASDSRAKGGTGLGLSICKSIVEQMGGVIGFESVPNVETVFYIEFAQSEFEAQTATVTSPVPNLDHLPNGGKI